MELTDFINKLSPYFTPSQIDELNETGYSAALDAHEEDEEILADTDRLYYMGREFICTLLWDCMGGEIPDNIEDFRKATGVTMTETNCRALMTAMDNEW